MSVRLKVYRQEMKIFFKKIKHTIGWNIFESSFQTRRPDNIMDASHVPHLRLCKQFRDFDFRLKRAAFYAVERDHHIISDNSTHDGLKMSSQFRN